MKIALRFFLFVSLAFLVPALRAQDLGSVRARMEQRLPKIDSLKSSGAVGENNRGLLEVREGDGGAASLVAEENRDREAVYAAIAKQNGATPEQVGRQRARQIAGNSKPGVWLQRDDGSWYKK